jgi:hypothetical protein
MKRYTLIILSMFVLLLALLAASRSVIAQTGGGYDLAWNTLAGGGAASGGVYTLDSAIGQPIAGLADEIAGPDYDLCAGYLCGVQPASRLFLPQVRK